MTWDARKVLIAICFFVLAGVAGASLALFWRGGTDHPSVPDVTHTADIQTAVQRAAETAVAERTTNDEAIKQAYGKAKERVMALSDDAVVLELNALLTELRGGVTKP